MYNKVDTNMNFVEREKKTEQFWRENNIFRKSMENRKEGETYTFYDGPPTANGKPHIGHVETRTIKDMIPRFQTMKGKYVPRKAGWDTHGLPVEIEVEKLLGLDGKDQIENYGLEPFIKKCKESVWKYKGMWEDFSNTVGFWADMDNPYVTYDDNFIESEWWALKEIWNKGLLYKGFKIVPYCPRCGTPLSAQEVAQGYKTVKEKSAVVRFKVVGEDAYFLAWTTTPWTLPSNVALCVNPNDTYVKVKAVDGYTYYMAEALADKVLSQLLSKEDAEAGKKAYEVLETYKGKDLEYKEYEPLYDCAKQVADKQGKKGFFVTCDTYVTMSDGTGIVHIAPAFGEDDANVGRNYDLPFVQFVNDKGELTAETPFAGMWVKDADPEVLKDLSGRKQLFDAPKFEHEYPHCWRCDKPLIYYARESWYIKETAVKDDLIRNNRNQRNSNASSGFGNGAMGNSGFGNSNTWYFYSQSAVAQGKQQFERLWGKRKNIDNWRRSNQTVVADAKGVEEMTDEQRDSLLNEAQKKDLEKEKEKNLSAEEDPHQRAYYLAQIPLNEEKMAESNQILDDGLLHAGIILKDKLDDLDESERMLQRLVKKNATYEHLDDAYYHLYLLYNIRKQPAIASRYLDLLKNTAQIVHSRHRSVANFIINIISQYCVKLTFNRL